MIIYQTSLSVVCIKKKKSSYNVVICLLVSEIIILASYGFMYSNKLLKPDGI